MDHAKSAERQEPSKGGDVKQDVDMTGIQRSCYAGQGRDDDASKDQFCSDAGPECLPGMAESGTDHDGKSHAADGTRAERVNAGDGWHAIGLELGQRQERESGRNEQVPDMENGNQRIAQSAVSPPA